jgi:hypothetical protein
VTPNKLNLNVAIHARQPNHENALLNFSFGSASIGPELGSDHGKEARREKDARTFAAWCDLALLNPFSAYV